MKRRIIIIVRAREICNYYDWKCYGNALGIASALILQQALDVRGKSIIVFHFIVIIRANQIFPWFFSIFA